jgi:hypothetical protein
METLVGQKKLKKKNGDSGECTACKENLSACHSVHPYHRFGSPVLGHNMSFALAVIIRYISNS